MCLKTGLTGLGSWSGRDIGRRAYLTVLDLSEAHDIDDCVDSVESSSLWDCSWHAQTSPELQGLECRLSCDKDVLLCHVLRVSFQLLPGWFLIQCDGAL